MKYTTSGKRRVNNSESHGARIHFNLSKSRQTKIKVAIKNYAESFSVVTGDNVYVVHLREKKGS